MTSREKIIQELNQQPLSYEEAKAHSHHLDLLLGYQLESIESALIQRFPESQLVENVEIKQAWVGLNAQSLQTPYSEFVQMVQLMDPQKNELWIDLGAGYGRLGLILSFLRPEVCFRGYELVLERVLEGRRIYKLWNVNNSELIVQDLADPIFKLDPADIYFIYDFGTQQDVMKSLNQIKKIAVQKKIRVIARGRGVRHWILSDCPWLSQVEKPQHFSNWSLFYS